jgi:Ribosome biogenesis protein Nop16
MMISTCIFLLITCVCFKNRTWTRYDPNPKVDPTLKEHWDPSKTPQVNLLSLGLLANPNQKPTDSGNELQHGTTTTSSKPVIELFHVPDSDGICRDPNKVKSQFPLSLDEEQYMIKCLSRYGTNYTRMFRDIKINAMQHTEDKLRKLGTRFLLLSNEQRHVTTDQIPSKVQELLHN